jgi:hypothetical protein
VTAGGDAEDHDRYTAVFTGLLDLRKPGEYTYLRLGNDGSPAEIQRGRPPYSRLGREVEFYDLPAHAQDTVMRLYREMWDL